MNWKINYSALILFLSGVMVGFSASVDSWLIKTILLIIALIGAQYYKILRKKEDKINV